MKRKKSYKMRKIHNMARTVTSFLFKLLACLFFAFPFYWMITTSFKTYGESIVFPPTLWPKELTFSGFITVMTQLDLAMYVKNSVLIILGIMVLQIAIMVPAAYAFAKIDFKGKKLMFGMVMAAFMVPVQITFISIYIMFSQTTVLGTPIFKTLLPQIIPFGANAFGIFLLRQSFMQVPEELIESARLDNASELKIILKLMLPMSKATIVTVALFSFISHWNSYFWPLVMTSSDKVRPITLALDRLKDVEYGLVWPTIMAGNVILVLPVLILFLFASRKIIQAMAYRGMK